MTDALSLTLIGAWFVTLPQMSRIRVVSYRWIVTVAAATFLWASALIDLGNVLAYLALGCAFGLLFSVVARWGFR